MSPLPNWAVSRRRPAAHRGGRGRAAVVAAGGEEGRQPSRAAADREEAAPRLRSCEVFDLSHLDSPPGSFPCPQLRGARRGGSESGDGEDRGGQPGGRREGARRGAPRPRLDRLGPVRLGAGDDASSTRSGRGRGLPALGLRGAGAAGAGRAGGCCGRAGAGPRDVVLLRRRPGRRQPLLLRGAGPAAAGDRGHARVRRPARGRDLRLAAAARLWSGRCWPRRGSCSSPTAAARGSTRSGAALALAAGGFWGAYIVQSDRVGALPGGRRGDDGGVISAVLVAPLGIAQGGGEMLDPAVPRRRRRGRRAQLGDPLRLRDGGAAAAAAGGLRGADEPRAGGRGGGRLRRSLPGPGAVEVLAIGLVVVACAGALRSAATPPPRDG